MDAEELAVYKHDKYREKKNDQSLQDKWFATFSSWATKDPDKGICCKFCTSSELHAADKLGTLGYGYVGEGAERRCVPHVSPLRGTVLRPHVPPLRARTMLTYCNAVRCARVRLVPVPSLQKYHAHQQNPSHQVNMQRVLKGKALQGSGSAQLDKVYLSVTTEDELLARTVRSVHHIIERLQSLNDMCASL